MTDQCDRMPRGASWKPTPLISPLGKLGALKVLTSPFPMLATSAFHWFVHSSYRTAQRTARAPMRPMVECSAAGPTLVLATALMVFSMSVTYFLVGAWPAANMQSTLASGPTWAGLPLKVGALTQEYFPSYCIPVWFGSVVSSQGCLFQSPLYQECLMLSFTPFLKKSSLKLLMGLKVPRSPFSMYPPGSAKVVPFVS